MQFRKSFVSAAGAIALLCSFSAAVAGSEGKASAGAAVLKPVSLTEFNALRITNRGPEQAAGVIYFIDGLDGTARMPDDFKPTYPYLMALNAGGWDVVNAKYPNSESDIANSVPRSVRYVAERIRALKSEGYKKVVLAGQSWGAWVSINVADINAGSNGLDGLMIVAPAAYGSRVWQGRDNPYYLQNLTEYIRVIKAVRTPTVAVFFDGDAYDPGERGDVTDAFFQRSKTPLLLIDRPEGFAGHGAGWLPPFSDIYAACIGDFLKAPTSGRCNDSRTPLPLDMSSTFSEARAKADKQIRPAAQNDIAGRRFVLTAPGITVRVLTFAAGKMDVATADGELNAELMARGNEACTGQECYTLYRTSGGRYLGFRKDGSFAGWLTPAE